MNRNLYTFMTTIAFLLAPVAAGAQTLIENAKIHVGNGKIVEDGNVLIGADGKIALVGEQIAAPQGTKIIDAKGKVLTPGLIDVSTRLGLVEIWAVERTRDYAVKDPEDLNRAAFRAADGFNPDSVAIPIARTGGVTSVVARPGGGLIAGQALWADLGGEGVVARVADPYTALLVRYGERGGGAAGGARGQAMLELREAWDDAKFYADNAEDYDENRLRKLSASRLDLEAMAETFDAGKPVMFMVNRASDIRAVLKFANDTGLRPIIAGGAEAWKVADELAEQNVPVIVNPMWNLPWRFEALGQRADNAALLAEAGVPVVISTFDTHNVRNLRFHAGNAVRAGMDHEAALTAVTKNAAAAFGVEDEYGTVTPGKRANLVLWDGDPFEFSTSVVTMLVDGQEVSLDNRQQKLFERYRELNRRAEPAPREVEGEARPETDTTDDGSSEDGAREDD